MIFITLFKDKGKPTKETIAKANKLIDKFVKEGGKILDIYWTLGRYDTVFIYEAKNEKAAMKALMRAGDLTSSETLVAIPRKEAVKFLEK